MTERSGPQPENEIAIHPVLGVMDWDDAPTAIRWSDLATEVAHVKRMGQLSSSHLSHDYKNESDIIPVDKAVFDRWQSRFKEISSNVQWVLAEGFLLYWAPEVYKPMDLKIFIREPQTLVKKRRAGRTYVTAGQRMFKLSLPRRMD